MARKIRSLKGPTKARTTRFDRALSIVVQGDEPPSEFRLFTEGKVETTKGEFLFDDKAAALVMAEYKAHGIDLMIDYDHASLAGVSLDPAQSGKAAGWFNLEVRGGELWAVNVRWTPPAAEALKRKEWRFMSPAFSTDEEGRVTSVLNVAITNIPATRNLEPLMAANAVAQLGENGMSVEEFLKVCKALGIDMSSPLEEAMAKIKGEKPAEEEKPKDEAPPPPEQMGDAPPPAEDKPEEVAAALSVILGLSGKKSFVGSIADVRTWHASHLALEGERQALAKREALLESAERRELGAKLVTVGGIAPARVWATDKADTLKPYLAEMPIASLRVYVADTVASKPAGQTAPIAPPSGAGGGDGAKTFQVEGQTVTLSVRELKICEEQNCKPEVFAMLKARRSNATDNVTT